MAYRDDMPTIRELVEPRGEDAAVAGFSRRGLIGATVTAVGLAATVAQAQSFSDTKKGEASLTDPGPDNKPLSALNKESVTPAANRPRRSSAVLAILFRFRIGVSSEAAGRVR